VSGRLLVRSCGFPALLYGPPSFSTPVSSALPVHGVTTTSQRRLRHSSPAVSTPVLTAGDVTNVVSSDRPSSVSFIDVQSHRRCFCCCCCWLCSVLITTVKSCCSFVFHPTCVEPLKRRPGNCQEREEHCVTIDITSDRRQRR